MSFDLFLGYGFKLSRIVNLNVELECSHIFLIHMKAGEYFQLLLIC